MNRGFLLEAVFGTSHKKYVLLVKYLFISL